MNPRRIILGIIGSVMLVAALFAYLTTGNNSVIVGVCSKVGLVLVTIFLAWPSLEKSIDKAPLLVNALVLGGIIFIAIRPRLFPLIVAGVILTLVVHFGLRFAARNLK